MRLKKSKTANKSAKLDWDYQPPKINGGKETIDDMSLVVGMYGNYEVTKTGNLVGILEVSGINLDLLNETEQQDVFEDYGAFLMSTLGERRWWHVTVLRANDSRQYDGLSQWSQTAVSRLTKRPPGATVQNSINCQLFGPLY